MPPTGRAAKPTQKVAKADNWAASGESFGEKNSGPKTKAAAVPYRMKSYHSMDVPIQLAIATRTSYWEDFKGIRLKTITETLEALPRAQLWISEADYPAVQYIPREDVDLTQLERTDHATYCPYKGDCSYFSIPAGGKKSVNAVWSYDDPFPAVAQIKGHVAFYPDRVDEIAEQHAK